jgi:parvulin-like peptidyl-prolyl isomerase
MSRFFLAVFAFLAVAAAAQPGPGAEDVVIADGPAQLSRAEVAAMLATTPSIIRLPAARDLGDRFELINQWVVDEKLAREADQLTADDEGYWALKAKLDAVKRDFMIQRHLSSYEAPPLEPLVRERYETQKDKYAKVPETRASSHILFASPPGLDRSELRKKAQAVLEELRAGADFEAYVAEYSEDPGTAARGGSLDRWLRFGDPGVTPPYTEALFAVEEVGGYSEVTDSQFGLHIIRLDGIREAGYKTLDEVRVAIIEDLAKEYRQLATKAVRRRYDVSDDAFINGDAMEELFAPYKQ